MRSVVFFIIIICLFDTIFTQDVGAPLAWKTAAVAAEVSLGKVGPA